LSDNIGDNKEYTGIIEAVYKKAGHCKALRSNPVFVFTGHPIVNTTTNTPPRSCHPER
jgi:hypothetical protein